MAFIRDTDGLEVSGPEGVTRCHPDLMNQFLQRRQELLRTFQPAEFVHHGLCRLQRIDVLGDLLDSTGLLDDLNRRRQIHGAALPTRYKTEDELRTWIKGLARRWSAEEVDALVKVLAAQPHRTHASDLKVYNRLNFLSVRLADMIELAEGLPEFEESLRA